jgi:hypothetical protein
MILENENDLMHAENLIKAMKRATHQLAGSEMIALYDSMSWLASHIVKKKAEAKKHPELSVVPEKGKKK